MELRDHIRREIAHIQALGGVVEEIEIPQDVQQELIAEMVAGSDFDSSTDTSLKNATTRLLCGLTFFEGYAVKAKPVGTDISIRYH